MESQIDRAWICGAASIGMMKGATRGSNIMNLRAYERWIQRS